MSFYAQPIIPLCYFIFWPQTPPPATTKSATAAAPSARKQHPTVAKNRASIRIRLVPNFTSLPADGAGKCGGRSASGWRLPGRCVNGGGRGVTAGVERRVMWSRMTDCWLTDCTLHTLYHGRTAEARTAGRGFFFPPHFLREQTNLKTSWRCHKAKAAVCPSLIPVEERGNEILWGKKNYMRYFDMSQSCMSPSSGRWWVHRA